MFIPLYSCGISRDIAEASQLSSQRYPAGSLSMVMISAQRTNILFCGNLQDLTASYHSPTYPIPYRAEIPVYQSHWLGPTIEVDIRGKAGVQLVPARIPVKEYKGDQKLRSLYCAHPRSLYRAPMQSPIAALPYHTLSQPPFFLRGLAESNHDHALMKPFRSNPIT